MRDSHRFKGSTPLVNSATIISQTKLAELGRGTYIAVDPTTAESPATLLHKIRKLSTSIHGPSIGLRNLLARMATSPHVIDPPAGHTHTHTVISLHGRDSTAKEFADELFESEASDEVAGRISGPGRGRALPDLFPTIRWVFPAAPVIRSERFDTHMSQWYDMWSVENPHEKSGAQMEGLKVSIALLGDLVGKEEQRIPRDKIFLAGISQGFTTAVAAFLAEGKGGFAGLIGWCSWMPCFEYDAQERPDVPVFLAHAKDDEVVPVANGEILCSTLHGLGLAVEWHVYEDGGHWINEPQGMDDMSLFIQRRIRG